MTRLSGLIHRIARGKHGHQHLTIEEAQEAFSALLKPDADVLQLGAFLIAQRMKGETAAELAGFVRAARRRIVSYGEVHAPAGAVDLPCYAGKRRAAHLHLVAAIRASQLGIPVVVHGLSPVEGRITAQDVLCNVGVKQAQTIQDAQQILKDENIVYLDVEVISPEVFQLLNLRERLGVRSCANSVARLLNPMNCDGQLNGLFHTPYAALMAETNVLLEQKRSLIFMGAEGEPELYADRQKLLLAQDGSSTRSLTYSSANEEPYPREVQGDVSQIQGQFERILSGNLSGREQVTLGRMLEAFNYAHCGNRPATWC